MKASIAILAACAAAAIFGGWAWTLPCLILWPALYGIRAREGAAAVTAALAPGLVWLLLFALTGDRRLYFCYSMQFAVHLACLRREHGLRAGAAGGAIPIAVFLAVRVAQAASARVLVVESLVAGALLALSLAL
ncbi:MAG: hypothetical protein KGN36_07750, partial [Acidobacteriota bacterium]|nr:hypothetical protein [Acidobacteriota bacterium]